MKNRTLQDDHNSTTYEQAFQTCMINKNATEFENLLKHLDNVSLCGFLASLSSTQGHDGRYVGLIKNEILVRMG